MIRQCGGCTLCCKLMPVVELGKKAHQRCEHQRATGCRIYDERPYSCRKWNCGWLSGGDTDTLRRPDRSHYVIDPQPEFITVNSNETGSTFPLPVLQIWCDPKYPNAHRDPALRAILAEKNHPALVRYNSRDAITLIPPAMADDGQWHEVTNGIAQQQHTRAEIDAAMRALGREP